jgi:prepilin-type N-terminal cleavage/methylation domain-containing protein
MRLLSRRRVQKGFTLIELMLVIIIIAILVSVAIPLYTGFRRRGKVSEAHQILRIITTGEKLYYQRNGKFTSYLSHITQVGYLGGELKTKYFNIGSIAVDTDSKSFTAWVSGKTDDADVAGVTISVWVNYDGTEAWASSDSNEWVP